MSTVVTDRPSVEIQRLARDMRSAGGQISRSLGQEMKKPAQNVASKARSNASWSTRIPAAIKVRTSASRARPGADIVVSGVPHGRLFEGLTKGGRGRFRHPVYGNRSNWVSQSTRPYLRPAVAESLPEFRAATDAAVLDVARRNGFT